MKTAGLAVVVVALVGWGSAARADDAKPAAPAGAATGTTPATPAAQSETPAGTGKKEEKKENEPPADAPVHHSFGPWITIGVGVALVLTAGVVEIIAVHEDDKRQADEDKLFSIPAGDPSRAAVQESRDSHDDSAKHGRTTALIVGTVGFVAIAGAVVWWFAEGGFGPSQDAPPLNAKNATPDRKPSSLQPTLLPSFAPGYAGASLGGRF